MIHTKLHIVHQIAISQDYDHIVMDAKEANVESAVKVVDLMLAAPKFCIDIDVVKLLERDSVEKSIMAILKAGIGRLPYSPLLVEFSPPHIHDPSRYFILLREHTHEGRDVIIAHAACLGVHDTELVVVADAMPMRLTEEGIVVSALGKDDAMTWAAATGVALALLMLNTKGIEKEHIHTGRINKARRKAGDGRKPIPEYTVVRIGTIYDRAGKGHSVTGTGRHMPVHMRAGHTRHQHFGKGNEDVKIIYIPPCIVNFTDESGEKPKLPSKEIRI